MAELRTKIYFNLLHHNAFCFSKSSKCYRYSQQIISKFILLLLKQERKIQEQFKTELLHGMQKQAQINHSTLRNFTWPSSPYSFISMANPRISVFRNKVIRTNTENSVQVGLFVPSLIHSFSFVYSNSK